MVWAANYNVFGAAQIITPAATADKPTITSNLRLPGQLEDPETGLHYNYRRYYDPSRGRYVTQGPIRLAGGDNQYLYVEGNPISYSGPLGLWVYGAYDRSTGTLTLHYLEKGTTTSGPFESGGNPFGDPIPNGNYDILA